MSVVGNNGVVQRRGGDPPPPAILPPWQLYLLITLMSSLVLSHQFNSGTFKGLRPCRVFLLLWVFSHTILVLHVEPDFSAFTPEHI